ncbi:AAA family ATPase [Myxococcus sp. CA051A]|uniref:AAA family ATPase n=1 Tax=Myxococcus sp. CA051A TaxID=2741739 RepID=UPI00157A5323|nr:AAA family ATPase [Myxococcus sp. CA051A]NTX63168.1 AAA family ATPase [Myxococcus sp. CA051A]
MKPGLRIDTVRVRRFGHFSDLTLELGPGLHLLHGPNEAGKSTLLAFLRAMLFGFERRGNPERYAAMDEDTPIGGELRLFTGTGPLLVRRMAAPRGRKSETLTVLGPDGEPVSEERLKDARGHVTRELFFDVFAFRLEELAGFEQFSKERGVSEALVAASMQGARRLPVAMSQLSKSTEQLYKPTGSKSDLNVKLRELEEVQEQLRQEGNRPALYFAKREHLEALGIELRGLEARVREDGRELERLARLESALGEVAALAEARAELESLPSLETFPEGGEARLEDALQRSTTYRGEVARLVERLGSAETELARLSIPSPVRGREEVLRAAVAAYSERSELVRALPARRAALGMKRRQVESALEELGLGVDGPGLVALDLSAGARAGLEALSSRLDVEETGRREVGGALARARSERERLDGVLARTETELTELPEVRPAQVRQQQAGLARMRVARGELERLGEQKMNARRLLEGLRGPMTEPPTSSSAVIPVWWVPVAAAVAVALAVAAWLLGGTVVGVLGLVGGLLLTGLLELARRRVESGRDAERGAWEARQQERKQEEERQRVEVSGLVAREELMRRELLASATEAGLSPAATAADMTAHETALVEALEQAGRRESLSRERDTLRATHDVALREERRTGEALHGHEARHASLSNELAACLSSRRFPAGLPAQAALALWRDASALRQRWQDMVADEAALSADEAACADVVSRLRALAAEVAQGSQRRLHTPEEPRVQEHDLAHVATESTARTTSVTEGGPAASGGSIRASIEAQRVSNTSSATENRPAALVETISASIGAQRVSSPSSVMEDGPAASGGGIPTSIGAQRVSSTSSSTENSTAHRGTPLAPGSSREAPESLTSGSMDLLVMRVSAALEAAREQETERRTVEERRRELREEKARLDELCRTEEATLAALLTEGGGGDEETFRRRAVQARRYAELTSRARELAHRIEARTGLSDTEAREALRTLGGEEGLRTVLSHLRARHTEAQEKSKAVLTEQGATQNQLEQWENDDLLARLRIQEETLRAKVAELASRYAEDKLALALLGRARRRFEEEQQPRVVQLASEHFALLTEGRYRRVFIPAGDEHELRVSDGERDWDAAQLSRGTREQLYLAFRLAVVRDFGETRGALPLIVDDVLVNFDPGRARSAIHLLARIAEHQQVIAFTCHPWLRELFDAEGAHTQALEARDSATALRAG